MSQWRWIGLTRAPASSDKKWVAEFEHRATKRRKRTPFGARGYEDFTQHKDPERARRYRLRHQRDLTTGDPTRAGYLSFYLLWGSPDLDANVRLFRRKFRLD